MSVNLVRLGDICDCLISKRHNSDGNDTGEYIFFTGRNHKFCNEVDYKNVHFKFLKKNLKSRGKK